MQKMMNRLSNKIEKIPISRKISLVFSAFFMILMITLFGATIINAWLYYGKVSRNELEQVAENVIEYIEQGGEVSEEKIEDINTHKNIRVVVTKKGARFDKPDDGFPMPEFEPKPFEDKKIFKMGKFNNQHYMYTMGMAKYNGVDYSVQVFRPQGTELAALRLFILVFALFCVFAILISLKIGNYISKKMLKPIRNMTATAEKITAESLSGRLPLPVADDEFRDLAVTFNNMFDRLEESFEKQKQFVSDASHELRTPISVIQGYANLIDRWGKDDEEVLEESISSIKSETEHINILINQLLFLARDDRGTGVINREPVNLYEIAREAVGETEMTCEQVECTLEGDETAIAMADSHLMKQLIRIIIENAVKYTKERPCLIDINVENKAESVVLSVGDNGIGMSKEDLEHIFDRFYRGDKSRNKQISGNGLGLSIAYSIVKRHGGRIWAESTPGKGSIFHIEIKKA